MANNIYRADPEKEKKVIQDYRRMREQLATTGFIGGPPGSDQYMYDPAALQARQLTEDRGPGVAAPPRAAAPTYAGGPGYEGGVSGEIPLHTTSQLEAMAPSEIYNVMREKQILGGAPWERPGVETPSPEDQTKYHMGEMAAAMNVAGISAPPPDYRAEMLRQSAETLKQDAVYKQKELDILTGQEQAKAKTPYTYGGGGVAGPSESLAPTEKKEEGEGLMPDWWQMATPAPYLMGDILRKWMTRKKKIEEKLSPGPGSF